MKMKKVLTTIICLIISISSAMAQHKLGDIIEIDGVKAIVWQVDETGEHGCAMGIKPLRGVDDAFFKDKEVDDDNLPVMNNESDGLVNTQALYAFAEKEGIPLSAFPAFEWV